jgi:hypothetical protein
MLGIFSSSPLLKVQSAFSIVPLLLLYCNTARYILYNAVGNGSSLSQTLLCLFLVMSPVKNYAVILASVVLPPQQTTVRTLYYRQSC